MVSSKSHIDILLVEDNPGDVLLMQEALAEVKIPHRLHVAQDGVEALQLLHRQPPFQDMPAPQLILLDLNLPRKSGQEVLAELKNSPQLKRIPVIVLTTSSAQRDVEESYNLHANCYITKPFNLEDFMRVAQVMAAFWLTAATLPPME